MTLSIPPAAPESTSADRGAFVPGFSGLSCRACGAEAKTGPSFVCSRCFGPLRATYDFATVAQHLTHETVARRPRTLWRYAELLPVERVPDDGLPVGCSPLVPAPRLAARLGLRQVWIKDDSRNPTLSFKDRVVAIAAARAREFGFHTLACASTGNLAASVAATAASMGLRAVVLVPADLEPAKVAQAVALGAHVIRVDAPYDAVNRLSLELTDELEGWAVLNVNLRPFYAEGSKTIAFEIAEQLGWRAPAVVVAPLASGSMYTKIAQGFEELSAVGLIERSATRYVGGQAGGCGPIAAAFAAGLDEITPVAEPVTIVRSLAIGSPADGVPALALARSSGGSVEGVSDAGVVAAVRLLAASEGILTETAGGVTLAALQRAIDHGVVGTDDEAVVVISGNGLKTLDVLAELPDQIIAPTFDAFEARWAALQGAGGAVR
ncbi:MAG TPA: threonine synthase [Candidatus Limnocylindria bacterium]